MLRISNHINFHSRTEQKRTLIISCNGEKENLRLKVLGTLGWGCSSQRSSRYFLVKQTFQSKSFHLTNFDSGAIIMTELRVDNINSASQVDGHEVIRAY